jgi:CRP-like cAMP-binding protein
MDMRGLFSSTEDARHFPAGATICVEGEPGKVMYVILDGEVEIRVGSRLLTTIGPGEIFGEMALIDSAARSASVVAKTDCRLAPVDEQRFLFLVQHAPFFALNVMRVLAERLRLAHQVRREDGVG